MARHYPQHRTEQERLRVVAFAFLTPFFFLRGGLNVSLGAVFANLGLLGILLAAKMAPKIGLVLPLARRHVPDNAAFTTLLMSTGLTFGTISSLYGLNAGSSTRPSSPCSSPSSCSPPWFPPAIAQRWFSPDVKAELAAEERGRAGPAPAPEPLAAGEGA